jgi:hypothetical protein
VSKLTRDEFRMAVAAAVSSVHHLYRELDRLMLSLRETLGEEPSPLVVRGSSGKAGRDPGRLVVRNEYGLLFGARPEEEDDTEDDEEDDEVDDEEESAAPSVPHWRRRPEIAADEPLLAVRLVIYDPHKGDALEPQVQYAVMQDWSVGGQQRPPGQTFKMHKHMLRRVARVLGTSIGLPRGAKVTTGAAVMGVQGAKGKRERRLACVLTMGVEVVPLYTLDSTSALKDVAASMKRMWAQAAPPV